MNAEEFLCARCAKKGKTCCQGHDIYITIGDTRRITDFTGSADFYEYRRPADPAYLDQEDDPVWCRYVFAPDGSRRVLKRNLIEDCLFLRKNGCILPLEIRPLVCRLHPYSYTADGISEVLTCECPLNFLGPGQTLDQALNLSAQVAERWQHMLYREITLENVCHENRFNL
ncbi:MAG: YkgJ family cysteine cluster protein [Proteobacteria bacterium]|nr:YkgJ family cysteine cluster protein [Pseudomonadota bacterium]